MLYLFYSADDDGCIVIKTSKNWQFWPVKHRIYFVNNESWSHRTLPKYSMHLQRECVLQTAQQVLQTKSILRISNQKVTYSQCCWCEKWEWERPKFETVIRGSLGAGSRCPINWSGQYIKSNCSHYSQFKFTSNSLQLTSGSVQLILARLNSEQLPVSLWLLPSLPHLRYAYSCGHLGSVRHICW